ncbi:hypothetical protein ABMA58_20425, partial [Oceanospirillum sp. HFRX-1_2]
DTLNVGDNVTGRIDMGEGDDDLVIGGRIQNQIEGGEGDDSIVLENYSQSDWDSNVDNIQNHVTGFEEIRFSDSEVSDNSDSDVTVPVDDNAGLSQGNNGHGNGDQDAPGNSGSNNNAENSDNSGKGNSGKGNSGKGKSSSESDDTSGRSAQNHNEFGAPDDNDEAPSAADDLFAFGGDSGSQNFLDALDNGALESGADDWLSQVEDGADDTGSDFGEFSSD